MQKKPMPKKRAAAVKKIAVSDFHIPQTVAWLVLFLCFTLATLSICSFKNMRSATSAMAETIHSLRLQRAHQRVLLSIAQEPKPEPAAQKPMPKILTSVVKFREGELEQVQQKLIIPLLAFNGGQPEANPLSALLIERKIASSKDLNVRLFFEDGTEASYLWPSTHSKDGVWTAPQE
jgi:hypothetical protein